MKVLRFTLLPASAVLLLGAAQITLRSQDAPPPQELVRWAEPSTIGEAPHEQPLLLEFTADWCPPCREMKLSTFRDPAFLDLLARRRLRPVRHSPRRSPPPARR